jgi:hypothetical protein
MASAPAKTLFDEILDFLASSPTPQQMIDFQVSPALQEHVSDLLEQNRWGTLSPEAQRELDEALLLDRMVSRLKTRALKRG